MPTVTFPERFRRSVRPMGRVRRFRLTWLLGTLVLVLFGLGVPVGIAIHKPGNGLSIFALLFAVLGLVIARRQPLRAVHPAGLHRLRDLEVPPVRHRPPDQPHVVLRAGHRPAGRRVRRPGAAGHARAVFYLTGGCRRLHPGGGCAVQSGPPPGPAGRRPPVQPGPVRRRPDRGRVRLPATGRRGPGRDPRRPGRRRPPRPGTRPRHAVAEPGRQSSGETGPALAEGVPTGALPSEARSRNAAARSNVSPTGRSASRAWYSRYR